MFVELENIKKNTIKVLEMACTKLSHQIDHTNFHQLGLNKYIIFTMVVIDIELAPRKTFFVPSWTNSQNVVGYLSGYIFGNTMYLSRNNKWVMATTAKLMKK